MRIIGIVAATCLMAFAEEGDPGSARFKLGLEIRGRVEGHEAYSGVAGQDDAYYLHRVRFTSTFAVRPWLHLFGQIQDSRAPGYDRTPVPCSVTNTVDLRQAYVEIGLKGEQIWTVRAGRQPLVFGDMRILSTSNWGNVGPAFDAVRLSRKTPRARLDWFASLAVVPVNAFDRPRMDKKLSGFHSSFDFSNRGTSVDAYSFWKSNVKAVDEQGHAGHLNVVTSGVRSVGKLSRGFDYNVEVAFQRGEIVDTALAAWLGHWEIGRVLGHRRKAPRAWIEYNYASGDSDPHDGRRQTFEQLYPSPLSVVGRAADFASRNLHEPQAGIEWQAYKRMRLRGTYRSFWLANTNDALYSLSGAVFAYDPGALDRRVGSEAGVWAICQATQRVQIWAGYANLSPGPYLKAAGRTSSIRYPYAMWTYSVI